MILVLAPVQLLLLLMKMVLKMMTVQEVTKEGLDVLGPAVAKMAEVEGLDAHRLAVTLRLGWEEEDA